MLNKRAEEMKVFLTMALMVVAGELLIFSRTPVAAVVGFLIATIVAPIPLVVWLRKRKIVRGRYV